ncbi:MAG: hypothetical protein IPN20_12865 [Haliscomenobacter sp.]|nr:hypothetical protein [Haliscomenobacter sp.]
MVDWRSVNVAGRRGVDPGPPGHYRCRQFKSGDHLESATTRPILPVLAPQALAIGVHPLSLMVGATIAASCAFMLLRLRPNAVVFGSGYLRIPDGVHGNLDEYPVHCSPPTLAIYWAPPSYGVRTGSISSNWD